MKSESTEVRYKIVAGYKGWMVVNEKTLQIQSSWKTRKEAIRVAKDLMGENRKRY